MEEDGEALTPFWVESSANHRRRRRRSSSLFLNSGVLVFLLCVSAVVLVFFLIPSVVSFTPRIFRPNLVKKSWDSINVVLVLFALVFGFLSRNKNFDSNFDEDRRSGSRVNEAQRSDPSTPHQWYEYSDRTVYSSAATTGGLRRTFSSYPDLREVSLWDTADDRRRFSDDTQVNAYRYSDSDQLRRRRSWKQVQEDEEKDGSDYRKTIHVDTLVTRAKEVSDTPPPPSSPLPAPPPQPRQKRTPESVALKENREKQVKNEAEHMKSQTPPSPPSPPSAVHRKHKRTYESVSHKEKREEQGKNKSEPIKTQKSLMVPPPPPPPPLIFSEKKSGKSDRKRGGSNATKDFLTSLYHQSKKKKKQRQKSVDNFETLLQSQAPPLNLLPPPSTPPPPPPPLPPPSVFHTLFSSKKGKSKRIPPPPPPPPPAVTAARASKIALQVSPIAAREPPMPVKISSFSSVEESPNSGAESPLTGCESPLIPIPPPPPPFKMPAWRYKVQGDYVRIESMSSSRSGSPDLDEAESPTCEISTESGGNTSAVDGSEAAAPNFCPSPDVNTKADVFIARFRAGLQLQKLNSIKQKQGLGLSNLGPESK